MRGFSCSLIFTTVLLAGCAHSPASAPTAPTHAHHGAVAHDNLHATLWLQSAAEYQAAMLGSFNNAAEQMQRALADPTWDALPPAERGAMEFAALPPAIIVDADETMIDNSPFQARGIRAGEGFNLPRWQAWVNERRALALPGALQFAHLATQHGVKIFYVTNRSHEGERAATVDNLRSLGFPVEADGSNVVLMGDPRAPAHEKGTRRKWVAAKHRVLLMLGDNLGDFLDGVRGSVAERAALMAPFSDWWGRRWIMLPNPSYGSWEAAARSACADPKADDCLRSVLRYD